MRFLSLFSGIEGASVALLPLGWECVAVAEVEPFPCAVLAHHYPDVPNLGDITKITRDKIEALGYIDVVIFGSPCQDFSVAGKRKGLEDEHGNTTRSGLFFAAMRIADWCRARFTWLENVPGMLSSKSGRDFAAVVGAMAGAEFDLPRDGWQNAGVAVGPCGLVEWTVLDAQYHGLAQRRRRVFVVRDSGDWSDRPPLFLEQYRLQGNPAPSRKEGQSVVGTVSARTHGGGGLGTDLELDGGLVANSLRAQAQPSHRADSDNYIPVAFGGNNTSGPIDCATSRNACASASGRMDFESETFVVATLLASYGKLRGASGQDANNGHSHLVVSAYGDISHTLSSEGADASEDGSGRGTPVIAYRTAGDGAVYEEGHTTAPLTTGTDQCANVVHQSMHVRRITPLECEKLQGLPPGYTDVPYRGKRSCDGPRYKSIGNGFAIPCIRWIGDRIQAAAEGSK